MKVQELRNLLSASDRKNLEKAFVESYKQLRKAQKEEIDPILTDILEGNPLKRRKLPPTSVLKNWSSKSKILLKTPTLRIILRLTAPFPKTSVPNGGFW